VNNPLSPEALLSAYAKGYFPMAKSRDDKEIYWFYPEERGIIPLDAFHIPRSLAKFLKKNPFEIRIDTAFAEVMRACAAARPDTWINDSILAAYTELNRLGFAHSVECWQEEKLVGGLYGVALGGAFFGESMFSRMSNASKAALAHLVGRLRVAGFSLLDAQFENEHLKQFGAVVVPRGAYLDLLSKALNASDNPSTRFLMASPSSD
jgi:leucyl/phenylalanyl-tRNA--protein transferase